MSEKSGQIIECVGCGSKWHVDVGVSVIAKLKECPLCEPKAEGKA